MMGLGYFVIAILGCADGGTACTPVATLPARYSSEAECGAATAAALEANTQFDFPTLLARCRAGRIRGGNLGRLLRSAGTRPRRLHHRTGTRPFRGKLTRQKRISNPTHPFAPNARIPIETPTKGRCPSVG